jgi:hypothetical protein
MSGLPNSAAQGLYFLISQIDAVAGDNVREVMISRRMAIVMSGIHDRQKHRECVDERAEREARQYDDVSTRTQRVDGGCNNQ